MTNINSFFTSQNVAKKGEAELNIFYTNDMHGDINRLSKLKTAKDTFEKSTEGKATLALTAGDCFYGKDKKRIGLISKVLNMMKFDAMALGNHEFTTKSEGLSEILKDVNCKAVSANLEIPEGNKLNERIADKKLVKSAVFMKGGKKFAVIGASPFDAQVGATEDKKTAVKVMDVDKTIKAINEEAKNLEKQGINKIILCSHMGYGEHADLRVARETEGVDVIIGGHSHAVINGVNKENNGGENKLNLVSSKRGEPVVITQAGKLNQKAGFLNLVFDEKGVIKTDSIVNKLADVSEFAESEKVNSLMSEALGEKKHLATVKNNYDPESEFEERYTENPVVNHFADAVMQKGKEMGVQGVLFTTQGIKKGAVDELTNYNVKYEMMPYNSKIAAVDITEKDLVDLLNVTSAQLFKQSDPALLRCGGMKYTVDQASEKPVTKLELTDDNGKVTEAIDTKNPSETKKVKVALDEFLFDAAFSRDILGKYKEAAKEVGCQHDIFSNYLESKKEIDCAKPVEKRITIKYTDLEQFCSQYDMADKIKALKA